MPASEGYFALPGGLEVAPERFTISEVLRLRAGIHPEKPLFTFLQDGISVHETVSFSRFDRQVDALANWLAGQKLAGKRVVLFYPPGMDFLRAFFGCLRAGVVAVTAYPPRKNRSLNRIKAIMEDCTPSAILSTGAIARDFERNFSEDEVLGKLPWLKTDEIPDTEAVSDTFSPLPDATAFIQYTSGSTGMPKGVMISHRNIMVNSRNLHLHFHTHEGTRSVLWLPQFHDMGLVLGVMQPVFTGYHAIFMPPVSFISRPYNWLKAITDYQGTFSGGPNFAFDHCVDRISPDERATLSLSSLDMLFNGAEPVRYETLKKFEDTFRQAGLPENVMFPGYGMAETTLSIAVLAKGNSRLYLSVSGKELENHLVVPVDDSHPEAVKIANNGIPQGDTGVLIADPETLAPVAPGRVGEILVSGLSVASGYWNNDALNREVFGITLPETSEKKWLRTGDLGFIHDGDLYITGRLKDVIIIRGRNFYPQDIEKITEESHPSLRKGFVAAFPVDAEGEEQLCIVAELQRTFLKRPDTAAIIETIAEAVTGEFEIRPWQIVLVKTGRLEKTSSGKIMRRAAREALLSGAMEIVDRRQFSTTIEAVEKPSSEPESLLDFLIGWASAKLNGGKPVDRDKTLAAYGLDSVKAVELSDETAGRFGFEWPPYLFFEGLTIAEMAAEGEKLSGKA